MRAYTDRSEVLPDNCITIKGISIFINVDRHTLLLIIATAPEGARISLMPKQRAKQP